MKNTFLVSSCGVLCLLTSSLALSSECPEITPLSQVHKDTTSGFKFRYPENWEKPRALNAGGATNVMVVRKGPVINNKVSWARITVQFSTKRVMNHESMARMTASKKKNKKYEMVKTLEIKGKEIALFKWVERKRESPNSPMIKRKKSKAAPTYHFYYPSINEYHDVSVKIDTEEIQDKCMESLESLVVRVAESFE